MYTENSGNTRAAFGDSNLNRVQSCVDLRYSEGNSNNQALRICIPEDNPHQLRTYHSVQNVSAGYNSNQMATDNNHREMGIGSSHHMITHREHHMVTGDYDSHNSVPEFLTGRTRPQSETRQQGTYNREDSVPETTLDDTVQINDGPTRQNNHNPFDRLADVIEGMNRPQPLLKPVNINTLVFDGKSDKFELFEDLFHTMLCVQPDLTEAMKINLFHAHLRKNALQTFRNINTANRQTLEDILVIFRRKYVKPESQATAKHKWHKLTFDPEKMKLPDFLEELNQGAEKAFGNNA